MYAYIHARVHTYILLTRIISSWHMNMEDLPGFRFFPTEEELISFYLHNKLDSGGNPDLERLIDRVVPLLDIYEFDPWELPQFSGEICREDQEQWFFFVPRQETEARGGRPRRLTASGFWKATGSPGFVFSSGNIRPIGVKRTMVFYSGRAPNGSKTDWKINEYKAIAHGEAASLPNVGAIPKLRQEYSLCRVYKHSKCVRAFDRRPPAELLDPEITSDDQHLCKVEAMEPSSSRNSPIRQRIPDPLPGFMNNFFSDDIGDDSMPTPNMDWEQPSWFHGIE